MNKHDHPILLFDGVCNLCNGIVTFVIARDPSAHFRFASLQSEAGQDLLRRHDLPVDDFESFILVEQDVVYQKSTAALRVLRHFTWPWRAAYSLIILPRFIRDAIYSFIAARRYRWFGKREQCMLPSPELTSRFL